ncbi:MAG: hypothetical protein WDM89_10510 [Rhizomicrobium sp.]
MGNGNLPNDDAAWATGMLKALPTVPVSAALQQNILASFDVVVARRRAGVFARIRDAVWPGAPVWRPITAVAFSLVIGVLAGTVVPLEGAMADNNEQTASIALDAPPAFDLNENS